MAKSHTLELALRHPIICLSILTFIILLTRIRRFDFDRLTTFVVQHLTNWTHPFSESHS